MNAGKYRPEKLQIKHFSRSDNQIENFFFHWTYFYCSYFYCFIIIWLMIFSNLEYEEEIKYTEFFIAKPKFEPNEPQDSYQIRDFEP